MTSLQLYTDVVDSALALAPRVAPLLTGFTASIDDLYVIDERRLSSLSAASRPEVEIRGAQLAQRILERIRAGRGGEIVEIWDGGPDWLAQVLGTPDVRQVGGNAAQASWALASVGAPSVLALRDRSTPQLAVLDERILVVEGEDLVRPVSDVSPVGEPSKWPHGILEFTAGTLLDGVPIPRTTRVMLRFSHEPLEVDESFAHYAGSLADVALVSGLATQPSFETLDVLWAADVAEGLRSRGALVHHELSEFPTTTAMLGAIQALPATSLGMSLSELAIAVGSSDSPLDGAVALADASQLDRVVVHADEWAFLVTREPTAALRDALVLGNALAGARAHLGRPSDSPYPAAESTFTDDHPPPGPVRDGWHAVVVPSPYLPRPRATVGLGDTFAAGLLLGDAVHRTTHH